MEQSVNLNSVNNLYNIQQNNSSALAPQPELTNKTVDANNAANVEKLLSNTSSGDYLQGIIVSKDGNDILLSLPGDVVVSAKLNSSLNVDIGGSVVFSVKSADQNGLLLSPLFTNVDNSSTLSKALENAGLEKNERNMLLVDSMMKEGMNVSKEEVLGLVKGLANISTAELPDAVTMMRLGIEPSQDNINQFHAYLGYEHQVLSAVDDIMGLVPNTISDMVSQGETDAAITMARDLFDIFTDQGAILPMDEQTLKLSGMDIPLTEVLDQAQMSELSQLMTEAGMDSSFTEVMSEGGVSLRDAMFVIDNMINEYASKRNGEDLALNTEQNPSVNLTNVDGNEFLKQLYSARHELDKNDNLPNVIKLISSKPIANILKNAVSTQWKLTPEQVGEEKQVSNLYKRITEQTGRVLDALYSQTKEDTPLGREMGELARNMNFMNDLNNMFNYVQLPMRLSGNDAHGELYVYSNKKHMASEDGSVSALLHLDMDHLGPTDVYVTMNTSNHVNTHFYMPDEEALDLIAMHIDELTERLSKRGYSMTAEYTQKDAGTNVMQEILDDNKSVVPVSVSNFDAKA